MQRKKRIAIIGAGLSGLVLNAKLKDIADISIYEKSRGLGGRLAQRRTENSAFNHGAPFITARSKAFKSLLRSLMLEKHAAVWNPRVVTLETGKANFKRLWFEDHFVGLPGMNQIVKALLGEANIQCNTKINTLQQNELGRWTLNTEDGALPPTFDWVISTAPAPQSATLLPRSFADFAELEQVEMTSTYALMVRLLGKPHFSWEAAVVRNSPLRWISLNPQLPPKRTSNPFVAYSTDSWAKQHLDLDTPRVKSLLLSEFVDITQVPPEKIDFASAHRWRYAQVSKPASKPFLWDSQLRLAACGDWCGDGRAEAAFFSARELARKLRKEIAGT